MRKHTVILISLLFMLLFSCTHAGAIDLAQGQYLKISEDTVTEVYVNIHSPSIIKCSPPYYTIQGETILHNKKHNTIVVYPTIYTYDYARQKIFFECNKISTYSNGDLSETFTNQRISGIRYNKFRKNKKRHGLQNSGRMKSRHTILKGASKPCLKRLYSLTRK